MIRHGVNPQIRLIFSLTKMDTEDFNRAYVTKSLRITPTESNAPMLSKSRIINMPNPEIAEHELIGISILPSLSPPYQMLQHAYWSIDFLKKERWRLADALYEFEQTFREKEENILSIFKNNNLRADLFVRVFAESCNMPDLSIPDSSIAFLASMKASVSFDFYLD